MKRYAGDVIGVSALLACAVGIGSLFGWPWGVIVFAAPHAAYWYVGEWTGRDAGGTHAAE
jgi:hypothetical protein